MTTTQVKQLFSLLALVCLTTLFTGCKKDLSDKIVGNWEVTSWVEDGDELLGVDFTKVNMEFEEPEDDKGDFEWELKYDDGTTETLVGEYEVDAEDGEIDFSVSGINFTLEASVDGDELEMEGTIDGSSYRFKADRD